MELRRLFNLLKQVLSIVITIEPIWNWDWEGTGLALFYLNRLQSNQYGIETLELLLQMHASVPYYNRTNMELRLWNFFPGFIKDFNYNRTNMELRRIKLSSVQIRLYPITIEPIWNWDSVFCFISVAVPVALQSNQYGIETYIKLKFNFFIVKITIEPIWNWDISIVFWW